MLSHMLRAATPKTPVPTLSYNGYEVSGSSGTTITFNSVSFGSVTTDRVVAVFLTTTVGSGVTSSVTIGGINATRAVRASDSNQVRIGDIWYASVPTGASGTVVMTLSDSATSVPYCASYSLYGLTSSTPTTTARSNTNSIFTSPSRSVTFTPSANGLYIAGYNAGGVTAGSTTTWTNATKNLDDIDSSNLNTSASASNVSSVSTTVTATTSDGSVNRPNLVLAAWR
jgi:flagellin-like hook-associated protein FlgL